MVKIITDSTGDLTTELCEKYNISILPLHVHVGDVEYEDGPLLDIDGIYKWCNEHKTTPKTSSFSIDRAVNLFKPYIDNGDEIVCFSISAGMSSSNLVMHQAAEELDASDRVFVVDSENLSVGLGILAIEASIMSKAGFSGQEIFDRIEKIKSKVKASFVVDSLTYLYRGGRCSGAAALAGSALKLHPKIILENGKMIVGKKYRGKISDVYLTYAKDMEEDYKSADTARAFVVHSGCDQQNVDRVTEYIKSLGIFEEVHSFRVGGVISSHCGYGTLGVIFRSK